MAKVKEVKKERKEKKNRYKNPPINIIKKMKVMEESSYEG